MERILTEKEKKLIKESAEELIMMLSIKCPLRKIEIHQQCLQSFVEDLRA